MGEVVVVKELLAERVTKKDFSLEEMLKLKTAARQVKAERQALEQIQRDFTAQYADGLGTDAAVRRGFIAWALRDHDAAREVLSGAKGKPEARLLLGWIAEEQGDLDVALDLFSQAAKRLSDPTPASTAAIRVLIQGGRIGEAEKQLAALEKRGPEHPEVHYLRGRLLEREYRLSEATEAYAAALDLDPNHHPAAFRLALIYDQRGNEDAALEFYQRCAGEQGTYVGAAMNLGLLYDEREEYEKAMACFQDVLGHEPNNSRAKLCYKNAEASLDMYYDEAQRKEQERMDQILRTPITDFEFSVRSRNCLSKMDIHSLEDLVQKSEPEMLAYKNFGETSLREIKEVLGAKGLRLGMRREETERTKKRERLKSLQQIGADSELLMKPISELDLGVRSKKAMTTLSIQTIGDLVTHTEAELLAVKNFGQTSINEVKQKLAEMNLTLKPMDG